MDDIDESEEAGIDKAALWQKIKERRLDALTRNSKGETDPYFVDAILTQAEESGDEELLELLDNPWEDGEAAISSDPEVRKKINVTKSRIESAMFAKATTLRQEEERKDKERHNALLDDTFTKINEDPSYIVPEETLKELSIDQTYGVTISWKHHPKAEQRETLFYNLAMTDYRDVSQLGARNPTVQIAEQLKKIREDWQSVARGHQSIRTDVYTEGDRKAAEAEREAFYREMVEEQNKGKEGSPKV